MNSKSATIQMTTKNNPIILGSLIAQARKSCGMTQQELCVKTGIAYSTLTKIERGAIKKPNIFTVLKIAQVTNLKVEELLKDHKNSPSLNPHIATKVDYKNEAHIPQPSKRDIKFVYFDLHEVLVDSAASTLSSLAAFTGQSLLKIENLYERHDKRLCLGEISMSEFNQITSLELDKPNLDWNVFYLQQCQANKQMQQIFDLISRKYKVGLLTNAFNGNVKTLIEHKRIPQNYDTIVDSSEIGKIKPNANIYEYAQKQTSFEAEEILLIDDRFVNIAGAQACGWQGFWVNWQAPGNIELQLRKILSF